MSLADFQRAFAVVVTDPAAWAARLDQPDGRVGDLVLSDRERERLRQVLRHVGMKANHLLLRANRMMPIQGALPLTCDWLRGMMTEVIDAWLVASNDASVQYQREATRFTVWIASFLEREGRLPHPALDALRYEQALAELARLISASVTDAVVDVMFDYDPNTVLRGWAPDARPAAAPIAARLCVVDGNIVLDQNPAKR